MSLVTHFFNSMNGRKSFTCKAVLALLESQRRASNLLPTHFQAVISTKLTGYFTTFQYNTYTEYFSTFRINTDIFHNKMKKNYHRLTLKKWMEN